MHRRLRVPVLLLLAALLAAACGADDEPSGGSSGQAGTTKLTVFAAASLTRAFEAARDRFQKEHPGVAVTFNFAGSQALATQIQQGAPADVFASADQKNMTKVADLVGAPRVFAQNVLEIVVAKGNPEGIRSLGDLAGKDLIVVLAGPEVPAGRYAAEALAKRGVTVEPKSLEDNVKGVVNKVALGSADAGIVYATDVAAARDEVEGVEIPSDQNVTGTYPIAVVKAGKNQEMAQAWVDYVASGAGQAFLKDAGFLPPE